MGRRGEHMHAGVRSRSKARARALEEHLVRLPTEAIRGNQRQSEAIRCNLVRLPTEGEGRLLLAGGFPCSEGAELRGRRAGHVPEGGRSSGVISFPCSEGAEFRGRRAGHIREPAAKEVKAREGSPSPRARAAEQLTEALPLDLRVGEQPRAKVVHLPSGVISGHQRSSEVNRGHQRSSEVIRGHQRSSAVISGHQRSS